MITQERLKELLHYNPDTGIFTWKKPPNRQPYLRGRIAGQITNRGYVQIGVYKHRFLAHRLVFLYVNGEIPFGEVDHINHCRLDNRLGNLRQCTHSENAQNAKLRSTNKSGYHGVYYRKGREKWAAEIVANGVYYNGGLHKLKSDAVKSRKKLEETHGFHKNHGE